MSSIIHCTYGSHGSQGGCHGKGPHRGGCPGPHEVGRGPQVDCHRPPHDGCHDDCRHGPHDDGCHDDCRHGPHDGCHGRPSYGIYCKRPGCGKDYCVTVRHDKLCLALPSNHDVHQLWHKEKTSGHDFMIINNANLKCVNHIRRHVQLELVKKPVCHDNSVLWSESGDISYGFKYLRTHNDHNMVMDAWTGDIHDGTQIGIHPENTRIHGDPHRNADNQLWKFVLV